MAGLVVTIVLLVATAGVVRWRSEADEAEHQQQLEAITTESVARLSTVVTRYADLLTSLRSFMAAGTPTDPAYQRFVDSLAIGSHAGVTSTGYVRVATPASLDAVVAEQRAAGLPGFSATLTGEGPHHAILAHASGDAAGSEGLDLAGDPVRWGALAQSAETGTPVIATASTVVHDRRFVPTGAALMQVYWPLYAPDRPLGSAGERWGALRGWAAISVDFDEALRALALDHSTLDMVLSLESSSLLAESRPGAMASVENAELTASDDIDLGTQRIQVQAAYPPGARPRSMAIWFGLSGSITALGAGYGVYGSLRLRRSLQDRAQADRERAQVATSRFHAAVDDAPVGVAIVDFAGKVQVVNDRLRELLQVPADGEISSLDYFLPGDGAEAVTNLADLVAGHVDHLVSERHLRRHDGQPVWCRIHASLLRDGDDRPIALVAHVEDIETERAAAEELRSKTRWFASIVERSSDLICLFDREGTVTWLSPTAESLLGVPADEILGRNVVGLVHPDDQARVVDAIQAVISGEQIRVEFRVPTPGGGVRWLETTASSLLEDPDVQAVITVSRDVTERHRRTEVLTHRATHDPLTGVANRAELEHRLELALDRAHRSGAPLTVAYLDLDGFKEANDTFGHGAGDHILRATAAVLEGHVREGDAIGRMGGDEFVLVLPGADLTSALRTVQRIREAVAEPVAVEGVDGDLTVTASIGLATAVHDDTVATLLRRADAALYDAKRLGRDRIEVSTETLARS